jgi:uncharacterized protein YukE
VDKIKVDTTDLRDAAKDLDTVSGEFKDANDNSDALADAVGHADLATHIRDFSYNWMQNRADMLKTIDELRKKLTEGADTLEKTDSKLAAELAPAPAATQKATPIATNGAVQ